ncbi:hypothetical protein C4564_02810 [Candidatus Microgenomates bacterium]|nr:MAG: hypothetical protein C4564_02810 [Candidatus Microgenomates bacterium]
MDSNQSLEQRVVNLEQRVSSLENLFKGSVPSVSATKQISAKEYLLEKGPKSAVEKTLFLGAYLEKYKGRESFTVDDLRGEFRAAREPSPANINDMINKNIKKGFFMEGGTKDEKKTWLLTATGEKFLDSKNE